MKYIMYLKYALKSSQQHGGLQLKEIKEYNFFLIKKKRKKT